MGAAVDSEIKEWCVVPIVPSDVLTELKRGPAAVAGPGPGAAVAVVVSTRRWRRRWRRCVVDLTLRPQGQLGLGVVIPEDGEDMRCECGRQVVREEYRLKLA